MDLSAIWPMVAGLVIPFVVGFLSRKSWKPWAKALLTVGISAAVGVCSVVFGGEIEFTTTNTILIVSATVGAAATSFWAIVRNVPGLQEWLYSVGISDKKVEASE
jgi:hypothetical protein